MQILVIIVTGIVLLWFGYSLFFGRMPLFFSLFRKKKEQTKDKGKPGDPQVCPICSIKLLKGELVKTFAFPSGGGIDRLMYIRGCFSCLENNVPRRCPICKESMTIEDYLIARMFERPNRRNHIHVLGCNYCRGKGKAKNQNN